MCCVKGVFSDTPLFNVNPTKFTRQKECESTLLTMLSLSPLLVIMHLVVMCSWSYSIQRGEINCKCFSRTKHPIFFYHIGRDFGNIPYLEPKNTFISSWSPCFFD